MSAIKCLVWKQAFLTNLCICYIFTIFVSPFSFYLGAPFIEGQYYCRKTEHDYMRKGFVLYKLSKDNIYMNPSQVMCPMVNATVIGETLHLQMDEYQWLCDSIKHLTNLSDYLLKSHKLDETCLIYLFPIFCRLLIL